jgi:tripartite-type tricarboxylate transporter receptor subunit TctC
MLALVANGAQAQTYPAKPVRMIVAYAPGGSVDIVARLVAQKLTESLGQQFVVENRAGASGNIGTDYVAKSAPDGYTLLMGSSPALAANTHLFAKMPFDPVKDLAPIILIANQPNVLVVHPSSPATNVKELIALAQSRPKGLTFGSSGLGGSQHIAAELFMMTTGVKMVHVPYKGGAPALSDLLGGHVDLIFEVLPTTIQHIREGRLRALAVTTRQRSGMLPAVPTLAEAGLADYEFRGWIGLAAPAALPQALIARLNAEVRKAMGAGDLKTKLLEYGLDIAGGTPEDFAAFMREDSANYGRIVKAAGIQPQ